MVSEWVIFYLERLILERREKQKFYPHSHLDKGNGKVKDRIDEEK